MHKGNKNLRVTGQEVEYSQQDMQDYIRCSKDIIYFAEKFFKIVSIDKGEHVIQLYDFQKKILKAMVGGDGDPRRHIALLSARQIGKSTISTVYMLWYALYREDKTVAVLANKEATAKEILRRIKNAYMNLPLFLQQGVNDDGWSQKSITLENGTRILCASTASDGIRGETISLLFLDEFAFVPHNVADDFMSSVYPTVASGRSSQIIIVSTPNGMNHFYHIYSKAVKGENGFRPIKINWDEVPRLDEDGNNINKKFKENTIKNIGLVKWNQEFGARFLGSSKTLIDPDLLEEMGRETIDPIDLHMGDYLEVYEKPTDGCMYMLGIDSGKGVGGDYSTVQVLKIVSEYEIHQVAIYRNNLIEPHEFAQVCISISNFYNECYVMIENNDVGGQVADAMFYEFEFERILNCDKKGVGIRSTRKSKLEANMFLKRYLENDFLRVYDRQTIYELTCYEEITPDVFQAGRSDHDDCVTSLLWGLFFITTEFFDRDGVAKMINEKYIIKKDIADEAPPVVLDDIAPKVDKWGFDWGGYDQ